MTLMQRLPSNNTSNHSFLRNTRQTVSESHGTYHPSPVDFVNSFYAVLKRWRSETAVYSNPDKITSHPSFLALVENAELMTPLIIEELRVKPSLLVWVLDDAFPERPYPDSAIGNITEMTNSWIAWAEANGRTL